MPTSASKPASSRSRRGREQGFTLLELAVVLGLMALIMGLILPGLSGSWQRQKYRSGLRDLAATLRAARGQAAATHQRARVFLDLRSGAYRLEDSSRAGQLPSGLRPLEAHLVWQSPEERQGYIAFYGDGSSSGGYLNLVEPGGQRHRLEVEIITGRVSLRTGGGT